MARPKGIKEKRKRKRKFPPSTVPKAKRPILEDVLTAEEKIAISLEKGIGRPKIVNHPKELLAMFRYYVNWNKHNPWPQADIRVVGKKVVDVNKELNVGIPRPLSLVNFCHVNGISVRWWRDFRLQHSDSADPFSPVIESIEYAIKNYILDGALIGVFQGSTANRVLNLKDHVDHTSGGEKINQSIPAINVYNTAPPFASSEEEVEPRIEKHEKEN